MIDPPPLIGPATPLRRVERTSRDRDTGGRQGGDHGAEPRTKDEHEPEHEDGDGGLHVDVRV